ncbi:Zn(2)-C6 fungal-type DNA-binding domain protein [Beauveria brongniartii RCEF 3172]|uniref:Zn(2)-C6 fungal-type DNA-binding domain protein n=1 Tax=Beauveria brongniartii RCEF 3172 TaxID=1081107 RepID=A0A169YGX9_9HYPO|nr:Zn(2)-C6 fungal-type DNA-binding domain protein [Beauveria brongniartii RCEF 3172]
MEQSGSGAAKGYASSGGDSSPSPIASHGTGGGGGGGGEGPSSGSPAQAAAATDGSTGIGTDPKKLRACEACRGLKVRCEPDPDDGPCRRCKKANRRCVVTAPTRKRQRKTDSRVSELEKKIDALTASLQARAGGGAGGAGGAAGATTQQDMAPGRSRRRGGGQQERGSWEREVAPWDTGRPADQDSPFQQLITMAGRKRKAMEESTTAAATTTTTPDVGGSAAAAASAETDDRQPSTAAASVGWPAYTSRSTDGDVVDRGLVPLPLAARLFSRYKTQMVRHLPGVVFSRSTTVSELRRAKPVLFLALMAAAAGEDNALQRVLQKELMQIFAQKVIVTGEKSLELVQALNVAVIWYWPPEYFEELKFYQLIHTAAVMAIDIGLGRRTNGRMRRNQGMAGGMSFGAVGGGGGCGGGGGGGAGWRGDPLLRNKAPPPDPTSLEARRTWLTCYYLASNTAMSLHRPNLIRWTAFMGESMALLESSADAAPTDKYFCHLVWTHRLGEQIGVQLSMDDDDPDAAAAAAAVDVGAAAAAADVRTKQALRALDSDLERYKAGVPPVRMQATLRIAFDLLKLYMHETVLHADNFGDDDDDNDNDNGLGASSSLSASQQQQHHVDDFDDEARTACLAAINGIFATFLALDVESIRCLPVFNFVRVAYAVVVLLKMYFSASASSASSASLRESMRVQEHLDALLDKFRLTAKEDKCRPASKFLVVLAMLRSWFVKQGRTEGGGGIQQKQQLQTPQMQTPQMQTQTQTQYQQPVQTHIQTQRVNTPLQLLSEVATGSDPSNPGSASDPFGYYRQQQQQQQQQPPQQAFFIDPNAGGGGGSSSSMDYPPWLAEALMSSSAGGVGGSFYDGVGGEFPTAMGIGAIEGFDAAAVTGRGGAGMSAATNDQFWTDMFQGIPDPNMFTF